MHYVRCATPPVRARRAAFGGEGSAPSPSSSSCGPTAKYCNFACRWNQNRIGLERCAARGHYARDGKQFGFSGVRVCVLVVCDDRERARACTCFTITIIVKYDCIMRMFAFFDVRSHARSAKSPRRSLDQCVPHKRSGARSLALQDNK